jgi:tetratricopeptide (TPR) repeat protein
MNVTRFNLVACLLLASVFVTPAVSGPLEDCMQHSRPRLSLARCSEVTRSASFDAHQKSSAYMKIGELRTQAGALKEAIWNFDQAVRLDEANSRAYAGRAEARMATRDAAAAIRDYGKALSLTPNESEYYVGRGHAHLVRGKLDASIRDLNEALRLQPENPVALNNRGLAHRKRATQAQLWRITHPLSRSIQLTRWPMPIAADCIKA